MNNCYANYGSTNARELAALLLESSEASGPAEVTESALPAEVGRSSAGSTGQE
jgi:hypothetical protein